MKALVLTAYSEFHYQGSYSSASNYEEALTLLSSKSFDLTEFTRHTFPLSAGAEAFKLLSERKSQIQKIILKP